MSLTIHWGSGSPNSWRVLLATEVRARELTLLPFFDAFPVT